MKTQMNTTCNGNNDLNTLNTGSNNNTITHIQIAELTGKRQDNVKRLMDTLQGQGVISFTQREEKATGGRPLNLYQVSERDSYVVVAQLEAKLTARLVDFWLEHNKPKTVALPSDDMMLNMITVMSGMRETQLAQEAKVIALESTQQAQQQQLTLLADTVQQASHIYPSKPNRALSISDVRLRANLSYKLPSWIVDEIINNSNIPSILYRNPQQDLNTKPVVAYWYSDCQKVLRTFLAQCTQSSKTKIKHPAYNKPFQGILLK